MQADWMLFFFIEIFLNYKQFNNLVVKNVWQKISEIF